MLNKIVNKIKRTRYLLKHGVIPNKYFDFFYGKQISKDDFNRPVLSHDEANEWLKNSILSDEPFFASRFGNGELGLVCNHLFNQLLGKKYWSEYTQFLISRDLGWEGKIQNQETFYDIFLRSISSIDGLGIWYNHGEQVLANYICPQANLFELSSFEPFFHTKPWTLALEGKKVLIIHPYIHSIPRQYEKRNLIFDYPVLPEFQLECYKPFTTYDEEWKKYPDAKAALDKMISDISLLDFDIALVGCGQYGLPLSAAIKRLDKQVIHIGGALQLFFGIIGKRWEIINGIQMKFVNEHWVRPDPIEIPTDPRVLKFTDNGSYW